MATSFALVKAEWLNETRVHFHNCPNLIFLMLLISLPNHVIPTARGLRVMWGLSFCYQTLMTHFIYKAWMFSPTRNITEAKPQFLLSTTGWFLYFMLPLHLCCSTQFSYAYLAIIVYFVFLLASATV